MISNAQAFNTSKNFLLAALPAADYQRLQQHMDLVDLSLHQPIYDLGEPITSVYFPIRCPYFLSGHDGRWLNDGSRHGGARGHGRSASAAERYD
jgi:hypothetical protein